MLVNACSSFPSFNTLDASNSYENTIVQGSDILNDIGEKFQDLFGAQLRTVQDRQTEVSYTEKKKTVVDNIATAAQTEFGPTAEVGSTDLADHYSTEQVRTRSFALQY